MVRAAALILLLNGCSQPMPAEADDPVSDAFMLESARAVAAEATPTPEPSHDWQAILEEAKAADGRAAAKARSHDAIDRLIDDMERRELEQRVQRLEDEKLNSGY